MTQQPTLTTDEALVLQQINEHGEDDVIGLEQSLRMSRPKLMAQLTHLKNKGLITVKMTTGDWWITVSRRGQQMMRPPMARGSTGVLARNTKDEHRHYDTKKVR